jgi:hypothetical protein
MYQPNDGLPRTHSSHQQPAVRKTGRPYHPSSKRSPHNNHTRDQIYARTDKRIFPFIRSSKKKVYPQEYTHAPQILRTREPQQQAPPGRSKEKYPECPKTHVSERALGFLSLLFLALSILHPHPPPPPPSKSGVPMYQRGWLKLYRS